MSNEQTAAQFRRGWIGLFLFTLTMINYIDRIAFLSRRDRSQRSFISRQ